MTLQWFMDLAVDRIKKSFNELIVENIIYDYLYGYSNCFIFFFYWIARMILGK